MSTTPVSSIGGFVRIVGGLFICVGLFVVISTINPVGDAQPRVAVDPAEGSQAHLSHFHSMAEDVAVAALPAADGHHSKPGALVHSTNSGTANICGKNGCHDLSDEVRVVPTQTELLLSAIAESDPAMASDIQREILGASLRPRDILDKYCLVEVSINPESRVKVDVGQAGDELHTGGWNTYLVKVKNLAGITSPLQATSEQSLAHTSSDERVNSLKWVELEMYRTATFSNILSGAPLEYRIIRLRTDHIGKRSAILALNVGEGTADIGFRNDVVLTFDCRATAATSLSSNPLSGSARILGQE